MNTTEQSACLETERLRLRARRLSDAPRIHELVSDARVAETTSQIPHPYPEGMAEQRILAGPEEGESIFAIALKESDELIGMIGIHPRPGGAITEIGFWIGVPYWGRGYCTEAAREILRHCFEDLQYQRVFAGHFVGNEASGRVQQKIGMKREGLQRWGACRFGTMHDLVLYGLIRPDWEAQQAAESS